MDALDVIEDMFYVRKQKFEALKGRFEKWVVNGRSFCFVGAHNIDGVRKLTQSLEKSSFDTFIKKIYLNS